MFAPLIKAWHGEEVVTHYDDELDTWMFIAIHSTRLGPAAGGTRMKVYDRPEDALNDALRLSVAMTRKLAVANAPYGGGKGVLAVPSIPELDDRIPFMRRYGDLVNALGGTYHTAPDVNTTDIDMDLVATRTEWVFGKSLAAGGSGNTAPATAWGVYYGIIAAVEHAFGSDDLSQRSFVVQGVGDVGHRVASLLADSGARVLVADTDMRRADEVAIRIGGAHVPAEEALITECDVLVPCALGGVLNPESIPQLRCRVVAGAANNQLLHDSDAELLRQRGILYAPDYVVNAGGVLHGLGREEMGWGEDDLDRRLRAIADTLLEVFHVAETRDISTEAAAEWMAERNMAAATKK